MKNSLLEQNLFAKIEKIVKQITPQDSLSSWYDWRWQIKNTIRDIDSFELISGIKFNQQEKAEIAKTVEKFPLSITPYYLSQIIVDDYKNDPIFKQAFPDPKELIVSSADMEDPLSEDADSPVKGITHRYPDRVLFHISNKCAMYCRHCTRKRKVGDIDFIPTKEEILEGIEYIKSNPVIRDVLLSGGDPLMLPDDFLDWILTEIEKIPHVEVIRIGTRIPVVLPYRVTNNLVNMLKMHKPLWINTHFNHPRELTNDAIGALDKLSDAGIPLGNQSVLLSGVNDCVYIMKKLVRKLVQNRVRPYYLYQCDLSMGLSHFRTPVSKGIEIIEGLRGHTSGFAVPTFVVDAPGGGGKIPVMPNYMISCSTNKVVLRNFEGIITSYQEPDNYEHKYCDKNCDECNLYLKLEPQEKTEDVGIKKLLFDSNEVISLVPNDMERIENRNNV
ncbi:MAG: lysine 2,3-aminomutase [Candidatus Gastranaerophilales bacterium]|nr:lysine 2,3-aminomutase [Candidatus Gastranaerophilales bacterium]